MNTESPEQSERESNDEVESLCDSVQPSAGENGISDNSHKDDRSSLGSASSDSESTKASRHGASSRERGSGMDHQATDEGGEVDVEDQAVGGDVEHHALDMVVEKALHLLVVLKMEDWQ